MLLSPLPLLPLGFGDSGSGDCREPGHGIMLVTTRASSTQKSLVTSATNDSSSSSVIGWDRW